MYGTGKGRKKIALTDPFIPTITDAYLSKSSATEASPPHSTSGTPSRSCFSELWDKATRGTQYKTTKINE
jgi:hypothetical protein